MPHPSERTKVKCIVSNQAKQYIRTQAAIQWGDLHPNQPDKEPNNVTPFWGLYVVLFISALKNWKSIITVLSGSGIVTFILSARNLLLILFAATWAWFHWTIVASHWALTSSSDRCNWMRLFMLVVAKKLSNPTQVDLGGHSWADLSARKMPPAHLKPSHPKSCSLSSGSNK